MNKQRFRVWWPAIGEDEETADTVQERFFEAAAEDYAKSSLESDLSRFSEFPATIFVRLPNGELETVKVELLYECCAVRKQPERGQEVPG